MPAVRRAGWLQAMVEWPCRKRPFVGFDTFLHEKSSSRIEAMTRVNGDADDRLRHVVGACLPAARRWLGTRPWERGRKNRMIVFKKEKYKQLIFMYFMNSSW
jgi:hypothetical protein